MSLTPVEELPDWALTPEQRAARRGPRPPLRPKSMMRVWGVLRVLMLVCAGAWAVKALFHLLLIAVSLFGDPVPAAVAAAGVVVIVGYVWTGLAALVVFIAAMAAWLIFVFRAARNLNAVDARVEVDPPLAVAGYFIPFANLVMPYFSMRDIWRGSIDPERADTPAPQRLLVWWWLWIMPGIISFKVTVLGGDDAADFGLITFVPPGWPRMLIELAATASSIAAVFVAIPLLEQIAKAQEKLLSRPDAPAG